MPRIKSIFINEFIFSRSSILKVTIGFSTLTLLIMFSSVTTEYPFTLYTIALAIVVSTLIPILYQRKKVLLEQVQIQRYAFFMLLITAIALWRTDFPTLATDRELAKLSVSEIPILMRYFRVGLPVAVFLMFLCQHKKKWHCFTASLIMSLFFGFKGYMIFPIMGLWAAYIVQYNALKILTVGIAISIISLILLSLIFNMEIVHVLDRLTAAQIDGSIFLYSDNKSIEYSVLDEVLFLPQKLLGVDVLSFNQIATTKIYGSNLFGISTSIFYSVQLLSYNAADYIFLTIFFVVIVICVFCLSGLHRVLFLSLILSSTFEGLLNGMLVYKVIDTTLSFCIVVLLPLWLCKINLRGSRTF